MNITYRGLFAAVCATAAVVLPGSRPGPAAVPGPGGVYTAVKDALRALDSADAKALAATFSRRAHGNGYDFDAEGRGVEAAADPFTFWDGAASANSVEAVLAHAKSLVDPEFGAPTSRLTKVRADCPSGECSWATFEFDRVWGEGDAQRVEAMRGTALVRYNGKSKTASHFDVMHWHAASR